MPQFTRFKEGWMSSRALDMQFYKSRSCQQVVDQAALLFPVQLATLHDRPLLRLFR